MKIERIKIIGLFKFLNYDIPMKKGINVLHGINGKGKTTILNIITNILNGDLKKFYQLSFKEITIEFIDNQFIRLYRTQDNKASVIYFDYKIGDDVFEKRDVRKGNSVEAFVRRVRFTPLFLPAQRVSLQETYYYDSEDDYNYSFRMHYERQLRSRETDIFQPNPKMTNILKIPKDIIDKARKFSIQVSQSFSHLDNNLFEQYFQNMFFAKQIGNVSEQKSALKKISEIKEAKNLYFNKYRNIYRRSKVLEQIEDHLDNLDSVSQEIMKFLDLYLDNIKKKNRIIEAYVKPFISFERIINELFEGKKVSVNIDSTTIKDIFKIETDAKESIEIGHLSSGEKNLILIFYHFLFQMQDRTFFMIDEPELSLHIDWQEHILKYFVEYSKDNQILVVTHSPDILQGYREFEINLDKCKI